MKAFSSAIHTGKILFIEELNIGKPNGLEDILFLTISCLCSTLWVDFAGISSALGSSREILSLWWSHPSLLLHVNKLNPHSYLCLLSLSLPFTIHVMFAQFTTQQVFPLLPLKGQWAHEKKSVCLHTSPPRVPIRPKPGCCVLLSHRWCCGEETGVNPEGWERISACFNKQRSPDCWEGSESQARVCVCVGVCVREWGRHTGLCVTQGQIDRAASACSSKGNQGKITLSSSSSVPLLNAALPCAEDAPGLCQDASWQSCAENGMFLFFKGSWFICATSDSITYSWSLPSGLPVRAQILPQTSKIQIGKTPCITFHYYFCCCFLAEWNWELSNLSLVKKTHTLISL